MSSTLRCTGSSLLGVALILALAGAAHAGGDLRVGTCQRDVTPVSPGLAAAYEARFGVPAVVNHSDPIYMAGFGNDRQATDYHDRLWARGLVIDGRGGRIALVALDLVGYFVNEVETIRALVSPASGIDYLVVHSTHQHEGPDTLGIWGPDQLSSGIDFAYLDFVNTAVADCVDEAAANLRRARVHFATADTEGLSLGLDPEDDGFGVGDGKVLVGDELIAPETEGRIVDRRLAIMHFTARSRGRPTLATLVNFGSHPESLGSNNTLITSDFPHYLRERLEARLGGLAIWVSGALGVLQGPLDIDVLDPETGAPALRRSFRWAEVHGTQLADRALDELRATQTKPGKAKKKQKKSGKDKKQQKSKKQKKGGKHAKKRSGDPAPRIRFASESPVVIPLANPYFRFFTAVGVLNTRRTLFTDGEPDTSFGFPFPPPFSFFPQGLGEALQTEVAALRVGEASIAVVPGELDPQIGDFYRERMKGARHTFIVGLGNDEIGYQVPFEKWDDSCHACAVYVFSGVEDLCPVQPIDCGTVFQNNVGQEVDPNISDALVPLLDALH